MSEIAEYQTIQMQLVANLITNMTIQGASSWELVRAVRHSVAVIDAKSSTEVEQSAIVNGIPQLLEKYKPSGSDWEKHSKNLSTKQLTNKNKFHPDARCVLFDELQDIATWCRGEVGTTAAPGEETQHYILVDAANHYDVEEWRAYVGDWILPYGETFGIWSDEFYRSQFEAASHNRDRYKKVLDVVKAAIADGASEILKNGINLGEKQNLIAESATLRIMELLEG
jgi:hypothetical protein